MPPRLVRLTLMLPLVAVLTVCESDLTTIETGSEGLGVVAGTRLTGANLEPCPNCVFEPRLFTRATGKPAAEFIEFDGNPAGAYTLETDDMGTRGAKVLLWLNGKLVNVPAGLHQQDVALDWENTLEVRGVGKPGSKVWVRIFQEVASVVVTPDPKKSRIPAPQQFTAVALDRNGVEIPNQTFTWESSDTSIATVGVTTGLAHTTGATTQDLKNEHWTVTTGEGTAQITASADGSDKVGTAMWRVTYGFVYATVKLPNPDVDPLTLQRRFRYDEARLSSMAATCQAESSNTIWLPYLFIYERQFKQCYPSWEIQNPVRLRLTKIPQLPAGNVGLYGRYCGGGHPGGEFGDLAQQGGTNTYDPKDPIDALCMLHDMPLELQGIPPSEFRKAACIVRWGAENDELYYEGEPVKLGGGINLQRWNEFWSHWPDMAEARANWIHETSLVCFGDVYEEFLRERGVGNSGSADEGLQATDDGLQPTDQGPRSSGRGPLRLRPPGVLPTDRR